MIKLKNLILENKMKLPDKFDGHGREFRLINKLNQQTSKIPVINKKSGRSYQITKNYYDSNKNKYTIDSNNETKTLNEQSPQNADEFNKKYVINNKPPSRQIISNNLQILSLPQNRDALDSLRQYSNSIAYQMNLRLRSGKKLESWYQEQYDNIQSALDQCEKYEGVVRRVSTIRKEQFQQFQKKYSKGNLVQAQQILSTTHIDNQQELQEVLGKFAKVPTGHMGYEMIIKSKTGAPIQACSWHKKQKQVLFKHKTRFKIIDTVMGKRKMYIYMEEV